MKISIDDPRLTAYALDELDPADRTEMERALDASPELKREVESIRNLGSSLHQCFTEEKVPSLDREVATTSSNDQTEDKIIATRPPRWRQLVISGGLAAAFVVFCGYMLLTQVNQTNQTIVMEVGPMPEPSIEARSSFKPFSGPVDESTISQSNEYLKDFGDNLQSAPNDENLDAAHRKLDDIMQADPYNKAARRLMKEGEKLDREEDNSRGRLSSGPDVATAAIPRGAFDADELNEESKPQAPPAEFAGNDGVDRSVRLKAEGAKGLLAPKDYLLKEDAPSGQAGRGGELALGESKKSLAALSDFDGDKNISAPDAAAPRSRFLSTAPEQRGSSARRLAGTESDAKDNYGLASNLDGRLGYRTPGYISPPPTPEQGEDYKALVENTYLDPVNPETARSTFSVDVDTASYSNMRRFLRDGQLPPTDAVRIEELINYFNYNYQPPTPDASTPFAVKLDSAASPWNEGHRLVRIAVKGKTMTHDERPQANLVFLCDVSGSMSSNDKLPLLKKSLREMVKNLNDTDRVTLVTYARGTECPLEPTLGRDKAQILSAIDKLQSSGGTNGEGGIRLAYEKAKEFFMEKGVNRVLLATDGDFNVGVSNTDALIKMVHEKAVNDRIFLTILGFGTGNLKDSRMEQIANKSNGEYYYIDSEMEGRKVLVNEMASTLVPIAKDVKIQVEFNPAKVSRYRLIGYANRRMKNEEFLDDKKDAGEIGAGHTVTAFYEVVPAGVEKVNPLPDLKYRKSEPAPEKPRVSDTFTDNPEMLQVSLRYKLPDANVSKQVDFPLVDNAQTWETADADFRFAAAVASFGMQLRQSPHAGTADLNKVHNWAQSAIGENDEFGLRKEFLELVNTATNLKGQ